MRTLFEKYRIKLEDTPTDYVRSIHSHIEWDEQLIAILGARGVGKSTLILQHIKLHDEVERSLYVSADDLWFANHTLYQLAESFYNEGGQKLYINDIHKYKNWSSEIKNIYDTFGKLKVVYTGSSILDLQKGNADLSRRLLEYHMYGLSFREYLEFRYGITIPVHTLDEILNKQIRFPYTEFRPLAHFKDYIKEGYYPYFLQKGYYNRLSQVINRIIEMDIPAFTEISISTIEKLRKLLYLIIQSVPFKPNYSKIGRELEISRNTVSDLIIWLARADLINILREEAHGIGSMGRIDKIYLSNSNISYALSESLPDIGNVRETIFLTSTRPAYSVVSSKNGDFKIGKYIFEVGGKNKKHQQVSGIKDSYIVKDDIEYGYGKDVPLWTFGLLY